MNNEEDMYHQINVSGDNNQNKQEHQKEKIKKSKLNLMKNVRGFSSLFSNSASYWKDEVINKVACGCDRPNLEEDEEEQIHNENIEIGDPILSDQRMDMENNLDLNLNKNYLENQLDLSLDNEIEMYEPAEKEEVKEDNQPATLFKISNEDGGQNKVHFIKEWTTEELNILKYNYYTQGIKNWKKLSEIIQTKSPAQCCYRIKKIEEKSKIKNFTRQDDINLIEYVNKYNKDWRTISQFFPGFTPESLEERYSNKLDPKLKRTKFNSEEDEKILRLYAQFGNNWKEIASYFPDRNYNMIKNRFYSFLKKKNQIKSNSNNTNSNNSYVDSSSMIFSGNDFSSDPTITDNLLSNTPLHPLKSGRDNNQKLLNNNNDNYANQLGININNISKPKQNFENYNDYIYNRMNSFNSTGNFNDFNLEGFTTPMFDLNLYNNSGGINYNPNQNNNIQSCLYTKSSSKVNNNVSGPITPNIIGNNYSDNGSNNANNNGSQHFFFNRGNSNASDDLKFDYVGNEGDRNNYLFFDNVSKNSNNSGNLLNYDFNLNFLQNNNNNMIPLNINNPNLAMNNNFFYNNDYNFMETYQKVFPSQPFLNANLDFDDSGSGNNLLFNNKDKNSDKDSKNSQNNQNEGDENKGNSTTVHPIFTINNNPDLGNNNGSRGSHGSGGSKENNLNNSQIKKRIRNKLVQESEIFNESKNLEDILSKIDQFLNKNKPFNETNLNNIKDQQIVNLIVNHKKADILQGNLNKKLNMLKQKYNTNKQSTSNLPTNEENNDEDINILLEINEILIQLIQIGKIKITLNKQLLLINNKTGEAEMEIE